MIPTAPAACTRTGVGGRRVPAIFREVLCSISFQERSWSLAARRWTCSQAPRVAVFGIGGVGGYTVEALARSGVGTLDLIDDDRVCLTNLNRQILATRETVGKFKVDVAEARVHSINPNCKVTTYKTFFLPGEENPVRFFAV